MSDWPMRRISDVAEFLNHKRIPLKSLDRQKRQGPYPYYGASGIVDYIDDYIFDGTFLLISEDGENLRTRNTPIAFKASGKFWVNNHAHILVEKEEGILDYLEYYFSKLDLTPYITGAVQPKLNKANLDRIEIPVPEKEERLEINRVLNSLSNKIELNRQINQTLEQIAQAIFKSWFVDFEPVKAKIQAKQNGQDPERAAMRAISGKTDEELDQLSPEQRQQLTTTAALFPDELEDSELGEIPKGWVYKKAEDIADVAIGKTPPRKESQWFSESPNDIKWVSIRDMGVMGVYALNTSEYLTEEAVNKFNVRRIPDNTVLLSFKLTVGRLAITVGEMLSNEAIAHFNLPNDTLLSTEFLYLYLKQFDFTSLGSTSSIATAVNSKTIKCMPILVPDEGVINKFSMLIEPVFKELKTLQVQNESLKELRHSLLQKLLSGEFTLNAKKLAEEAVA